MTQLQAVPARSKPQPTITTDENTGRRVRQLTHVEEGRGASLGYFRFRKHLPDGRMMIRGRHGHGNLLLLDPESGAVEPLAIEAEMRGYCKLQAGGRRLWNYRMESRELWAADMPHGRAELVARLPADLPGHVADISCDGATALIRHVTDDRKASPSPSTGDVADYWKYVARPRHGEIWAYHLSSGNATRIVSVDGSCPDHIESSPTDPTLVRYCLDVVETKAQRIWCVRTDGSDNRMIRRQEVGEMITHEFWWSDGCHVGYTYQDRRNDPTVDTIPLAEYSPVPTRLGIADAAGGEVYLSGPLNSYHTHLYVSPDGRYVCGEGTHDKLFVYAAPFAWDEPDIDLVPLATVHTPYQPFAGNYVNCNFSADGKWLLYNDTLDGRFQVFAVEVGM